MWSHPPTAVNSSSGNTTFGMDVTHFCDTPTTSKDALLSQCPIVCFNASTVLQSVGRIASRTLLPSSDVQGESRERTYRPTTWYYAHAYDTPAQYSDALFEKGAPAILAHECILSVLVQTSSKDQRHPQCVNAHAPSCVDSGMMISLSQFYQPKKPRPVMLSETLEFNTVENMYEVLNTTLSVAEDFVEVPAVRTDNRILNRKPGDHIQHKTCHETNCEELVYVFDQRNP